MKKLLKKHFGYDEFRPLQGEIIEHVLEKQDAFVLMPTGGGKSLCYQLPALKFEGITLVISPLIALMKDQVDGLKANGISAEFINSTLSIKEIDDIKNRAKNNDLKILYLAPERLALPDFQQFLNKLTISLIAIDEAHCISEWGHDFRPDYRNLKVLKTIFPQIPIIALTATATEQVKQDILKQLSLNKAKLFVSSFNRENLNLSVINKQQAFHKLVNLLSDYKDKSVIIYCFSRKDTENITDKLNANGFNALPYHAGLSTEERKRHQDLFIKDSVNIIVATIAFGMGIDKPDVRLVVHYTYPKTLESYYQEIGRAGRDGLASDCVMFYTYADTRKHEFFIGQNSDEKSRLNSQEKLNEVLNYAEGNICRKKHLLKYFGEELKQNNCKSCDICLSSKEKFDATLVVQKILSTILRTDNSFGKNHIIDVLLGKNTQQIRRHKHNELSVFGIINDYSKEELGQIVQSLLDLGFIKKNNGRYPTLAITKQGADFLSNNEKIELLKPKIDSLITERQKNNLEYDSTLFEILRAYRKEIAEKQNVPPFVIFGDKSLQEMAYYLPATKEAFGKINGVGANKLEKFGKIFLEKINEYKNDNNLESKEIIKIINPTKKSEVTTKQRFSKPQFYQKTLELIQKKLPIKRIAKNQKLKLNTVINHIEKMLDDEVIIDIEYLKLPKQRFEDIKNAFLTCEDEKLKPVFELLDGKYNYDEIRLVRTLMKK